MAWGNVDHAGRVVSEVVDRRGLQQWRLKEGAGDNLDAIRGSI